MSGWCCPGDGPSGHFLLKAHDALARLAFAERFDGKLHTKTGAAALSKSRFGNEALSDISNVDQNGELMQAGDRRRMYGLGNRLWHTDASFEDPPGRYSMLHARVVPAVDADTELPTCAPPTTSLMARLSRS